MSKRLALIILLPLTFGLAYVYAFTAPEQVVTYIVGCMAGWAIGIWMGMPGKGI